jgi:hypothetical protein
VADDDKRARSGCCASRSGYYRDPARAATLLLEEAERLESTDRAPAALPPVSRRGYRAMLRDADGALEAALLTRGYDATGGDDPFAGVVPGTGSWAAGRPGEAGPLADSAVALFQSREWRYDKPRGLGPGLQRVFAAATLLWLGEHETLRARIESLASEFVPGDECA